MNKDYVGYILYIDSPSGFTPEGYIERLRETRLILDSQGVVDATIDVEYWDGSGDTVIRGLRPMTEKELEQAKKRRAKEAERKVAGKLAQEKRQRSLYETLKKKYE